MKNKILQILQNNASLKDGLSGNSEELAILEDNFETVAQEIMEGITLADMCSNTSES